MNFSKEMIWRFWIHKMGYMNYWGILYTNKCGQKCLFTYNQDLQDKIKFLIQIARKI